MKKLLSLCLTLVLIISLCSCDTIKDFLGRDDTDIPYVPYGKLLTFDENGEVNGFFDFVHEGGELVGINQCGKDGKVLLYGSGLEFDESGNVTNVVFRDGDGKIEKTIKWRFPDGISPHAINFSDGLTEKYLAQFTFPEPDVSTINQGYEMSLGPDGTTAVVITHIPAVQNVTITSDTFFTSPTDCINLSMCSDEVNESVFDSFMPIDINDHETGENSYIAVIYDGDGRARVIHVYSTSLYAASTHHVLYTYGDDEKISEYELVDYLTFNMNGMFSSDSVTISNFGIGNHTMVYYSRVVPEYDENGIVVSAKAYNKNGTENGNAVFENGVIVESRFVHTSGEESVNEFTNGSITKITTYYTDGERWVYEYAEDGNETVTHYDADGNIVPIDE